MILILSKNQFFLKISFVLVGPEIPFILGITDFIINDPDLNWS